MHRSDGSGTTFIFSSYLALVSPEWKEKVGAGKSVKWPAPNSVGGKGNEGVAGQVKVVNAPSGTSSMPMLCKIRWPMRSSKIKPENSSSPASRVSRRGRQRGLEECSR